MKALLDYTHEVDAQRAHADEARCVSIFPRRLRDKLPSPESVELVYVGNADRTVDAFIVKVRLMGVDYTRTLIASPWLYTDFDIAALATDIAHEHWQSMLDI